jgi:hypothetical protein
MLRLRRQVRTVLTAEEVVRIYQARCGGNEAAESGQGGFGVLRARARGQISEIARTYRVRSSWLSGPRHCNRGMKGLWSELLQGKEVMEEALEGGLCAPHPRTHSL